MLNNESNSFKVLVVDDDINISDSVSYVLGKEGFDTNTAGTGSEALSKIASFKPDAIILDLNLPDMLGFDVLKSLPKDNSVVVIMLTSKDDVMDKISGLELGADDYMTKPFNMKELVTRLKTVLRRLKPSTKNNSRFEFDGLVLDLESRKTYVNNETIELTNKEFDLLTLFFSNPERVFSREHLLDKIWGIDKNSGERSVDITIVRIRKKLGNELGNIIKTVHGAGYKFSRFKDV